jgi:hypothetical protein
MSTLFQLLKDVVHPDNPKERFLQDLLKDIGSQLSLERVQSNHELFDALADASVSGGVDDKQYVVCGLHLFITMTWPLMRNSKRSSYSCWLPFQPILTPVSLGRPYWSRSFRRILNILQSRRWAIRVRALAKFRRRD